MPEFSRDASLSRTDWSLFGPLASGDTAREAEAIDRLVRRYWPAVYAFVRAQGHDVHAASDLTQAFVADVLLGRRLLHAADPGKGRFRHLLLQSLRNFLHEQHRHATRRKRSPAEQRVVSLEASGSAEPARSETPEQAFDEAWCRALVASVLAMVAKGCRRDGLDAHWAVFEARIVGPMLQGARAPDYAALAARHDLPSPAHAANLMITVKRRFIRALRREIERTVRRPEDVDAELRELLGHFEGE